MSSAFCEKTHWRCNLAEPVCIIASDERNVLVERSDAELVAWVVERGDTDAYGELITRYQGHAYGLAYSILGDWNEAQDMAQEAFLRAYVNLPTLRDRNRFAAWLRRIVFSSCMEFLRSHRPDVYQSLGQPNDVDQLDLVADPKPNQFDHVVRKEMAQVVLAAIAELPPKYRIPLTMFHLDGLSYDKVAEFLELPVGTVKSLISRARSKLKTALEAYAKEALPMVQEVFNEHKLTAEFSRKILENVPVLAWGQGRECTFVGALEAALAVTDHRYSYTDLMGYTALAFRVRWFKPNDETRWCPSCAVGEMEEEITAAARATGWALPVELHIGDPHIEQSVPRILASINEGKPVLAYSDHLDVGVVYGYTNDGKTLLFRDYHKGAAVHELPASSIGWMWIHLGEHGTPLAPREAVTESLRMAVKHWTRGEAHAGPGVYWYGGAAYDAWKMDIASAGTFSDEDRGKLFFVGWWNFTTLLDARHAGVAYLRERASLLALPLRDAASRAAALYEKECQLLGHAVDQKDAFLGPWSGKTVQDWSDAVRAREVELLSQVAQLEDKAASEFASALA